MGLFRWQDARTILAKRACKRQLAVKNEYGLGNILADRYSLCNILGRLRHEEITEIIVGEDLGWE